MHDVCKALEKPEMAYRPRNYWGWLENITPEETRRQIDCMAKAGLGGYVMHARGGLTIPYAGQQWMDSVRAMIDQGKKYGMLTIVDDEHGWPSGFGAGKVNGRGEKYQLKYLKCELADADAPQKPHTLGTWPRQDGKELRIFAEVDPYYVDNMDPDVVDAFIEASYEDYNAQVGSEFGGGVYGIFSDEPQTARYATPWSDTLPELFEKEYGYPLLPELYKVFENVTGCEKLRCDFYGLMARCFAENYAKRLGRWCESRGLAFMGHTCLEEEFAGQLRCAVATMPFYEYMTVPGIDLLGRVQLQDFAVLQMTSVAAQTGKKRALCEMFGCAGWSVTPEQMKWMAQRMHALGVNDQLQHLGLYSLRGSRKREYPASIFYQQPWFEKLGPYNAYFARISKLVAESDPLTDVLVVHPMHTAWAQYDGTEPSLDELTRSFDTLISRLLGVGAFPHLGDETVLRRHGRAVGAQLEVGACRYDKVLLPELSTIDTFTYKLLKEYTAAGGELYVIGGLPTMLDGVPAAVELPCTVIGKDEATLRHVFAKTLSVYSASGLVHAARWNWRGREFWYVTNNDPDASANVRLEWSGSGSLYEYDPMENRLSDTPAEIGALHMAPGQTMLLFVGEKAQTAAAKKPVYANSLRLDGEWTVVAAGENALTLDTCRLSLDGVNYGEEEYILDIQKRLLTESCDRDVWLEFRVRSEYDADVYLLAEDPAKCRITVNGEAAGAPCGWRVDTCLEAMPIHIRAGENRIVVARRFENDPYVYYVKNHHIHEAEANRVTVDTELESIYLWGDFAVKAQVVNADAPRRTITARDFVVCPPQKTADIAALEQSGLLFFAGEVTLEKTFTVPEACTGLVRFARPDAGVTQVSVNGGEKSFFWAPYEMPVSLCAGENTVRITLTNSCRNLFGPHYHPDYDFQWVHPGAFGRELPDMCFVRFGIEEGLEILY